MLLKKYNSIIVRQMLFSGLIFDVVWLFRNRNSEES